VDSCPVATCPASLICAVYGNGNALFINRCTVCDQLTAVRLTVHPDSVRLGCGTDVFWPIPSLCPQNPHLKTCATGVSCAWCTQEGYSTCRTTTV
jgi:hypothetical protein